MFLQIGTLLLIWIQHTEFEKWKIKITFVPSSSSIKDSKDLRAFASNKSILNLPTVRWAAMLFVCYASCASCIWSDLKRGVVEVSKSKINFSHKLNIKKNIINLSRLVRMQKTQNDHWPLPEDKSAIFTQLDSQTTHYLLLFVNYHVDITIIFANGWPRWQVVFFQRTSKRLPKQETWVWQR